MIMTTKDGGNQWKWSCISISLITLIIVSCLLENEVAAKGMARGTANRNGGSGRTYLKKFGHRSVVYQRKIFNTKYQTADEIGNVGTRNSDKFKRKLSDGSSIVVRPKTDSPQINISPNVH